MGKSCHFLCRKARQILMRGLRRDGLGIKLVVGCLDFLSQLRNDVD